MIILAKLNIVLILSVKKVHCGKKSVQIAFFRWQNGIIFTRFYYFTVQAYGGVSFFTWFGRISQAAMALFLPFFEKNAFCVKDTTAEMRFYSKNGKIYRILEIDQHFAIFLCVIYSLF